MEILDMPTAIALAKWGFGAIFAAGLLLGAFGH